MDGNKIRTSGKRIKADLVERSFRQEERKGTTDKYLSEGELTPTYYKSLTRTMLTGGGPV